MPKCTEWGEEWFSECSQTREETSTSCSSWHPWTEWLCLAWATTIQVVCIAWIQISIAVCVVWDIVTTVIRAVVVTFESTIGWFFIGVFWIFELALAIPYIGPVLRIVINTVTELFWLIVGAFEFGLSIIGIRPEKILRVCVIILRDEEGVPVASKEFVKDQLQVACLIFKRDANIRIIPNKPFKYTTGFSDHERIDDSWITVDDSSSSTEILDENLDPLSGLNKSRLSLLISKYCYFGSQRRLTGYGSPVTCFVVRRIPDPDMPDGEVLGISMTLQGYVKMLGDIAAFNRSVILPESVPALLAHEFGHNRLLWHTCQDDDPENLMIAPDGCTREIPSMEVLPVSPSASLNYLQISIMRTSKSVTYF